MYKRKFMTGIKIHIFYKN